MEKIECVIVCTNFGKYLEKSLPINEKFFNNVVVVSDKTDIMTHDICNNLDVECVDLKDPDKQFKKGKYLNYGYTHLKYNEWVLNLDADIILTKRFYDIKDNLKWLSRNILYGRKTRIELGDRDINDWESIYNSEKDNLRCELNNMLNPVGFFQLFHASHFHNVVSWYPIVDLTNNDKIFRKKFRQHKMLEDIEIFTRFNFDGVRTYLFDCIHLKKPVIDHWGEE